MASLTIVLASFGTALAAHHDTKGASAVRFVHLSPDAPAVDVWIDGQRVIENLAFSQRTTYAKVVAGAHNVKVVPAGATEPVVIDADVRLKSGMAYSVLAVGKLAELEARVVADRLSSAEDARVRFVHASPDAIPVDIAVDGKVLFEDVAFGEATDYATVESLVDLEVRAAGHDVATLAMDDVALHAGGMYTAYAIGLAEDGSIQVVMSPDVLVSAEAPS